MIQIQIQTENSLVSGSGSVSFNGLALYPAWGVTSDPSIKENLISEVMEKPFQFVPVDTTLDVLSSMINRDNPAVMVRDSKGRARIITQHDLLESIASL